MTESLTFPALFDLPVTVDMRTAAAALGISSNTAYRLAVSDSFLALALACVSARVTASRRSS